MFEGPIFPDTLACIASSLRMLSVLKPCILVKIQCAVSWTGAIEAELVNRFQYSATITWVERKRQETHPKHTKRRKRILHIVQGPPLHTLLIHCEG